MNYLFLLIHFFFVFLMLRSVYLLLCMKKLKEAMIGLFMTFVIVPDFVLLDAFNIPGTFILVFLFKCLIPYVGILKAPVFRLQKGDGLLAILLLGLFVFALYTKFIIGVTTDYYGKKVFGYIYTLVIPMTVIMYYKDVLIKSYDLWKSVLVYAILAYAFKNFFLVGIFGFREKYMLNYEELKNVIFAAQVLAIGAIMCLYDLLRNYEVKTLLCLSLLLLQIILFESRGPMLSVAIAAFILWWFKSGKEVLKKYLNPRMILGLSVFGIAAIVGLKFLWDAGYLERIATKLNMLTSGNRNETRYFLFPITLQAIKESFPWGLGFGNTKIGVMRINSYFNNDYPHNIILELLLEEGVFISIPIFLIFLKWFCSIFGKERFAYHTLLFFALYAFSFVNAMFSGDISGNSYLFFFGYLAYHSKEMATNESALDMIQQFAGGYL